MPNGKHKCSLLPLLSGCIVAYVNVAQWPFETRFTAVYCHHDYLTSKCIVGSIAGGELRTVDMGGGVVETCEIWWDDVLECMNIGCARCPCETQNCSSRYY